MGAEQSVPAGVQVLPAEPVPAEPNVPASSSEDQQAAMPSALVLVGPSGVGKGTLAKALLQAGDHYGFSVSHTTRPPRPNEQHGVHYYFTSKEQFAKEVGEGKFLEYAEVHGNLYGTSLAAVRNVLEGGKVCVLDIDVQGARSMRKAGLKAIFAFIAPPSLEDLANRLAGRGTDSIEQITRRLNNAKLEIESINEKGLYDYLLINDDLEEAVKRLRAIGERAAAGLGPEPGMVPERVVLEDAPLPDIRALTEQQQASTAASTPRPTEPESEPVAEAPTVAAVLDAAAAGPAAPALPVAPAAPAPPPMANGGGSGQLAVEGVPPGFEKWQGRVALVTGASSGIGWATCEALALAGMRVVAVARRKDRLEELQRHMHAMGVPLVNFLPVVCDITKEAEVATLPKIVAKRWPDCGVDVLINNAGMSRNDASLFDGNIGSWVEMLSTNVLGTCMMTRAVVQDMKRRGSYGHIVNMIGLSGHRIPDGPQGGGFYSATKSAIKTITEGLRQEPLRVSGISPGLVETEFFTVRAFGDADATRKATSAYKCLQPVDVADAVMWCLSCPDHMEVNDIVVRPTEQLV
ncbi:Dehydrogenase/reductase SDR family member 11 [Tetrabaena socialis]|uniref:Guanylate kinase 1 n=1 Tax=Tetrabaena socialis TaxID=47790 RepID=A0A2J8ACR4_9CHLO|nr:Dehydrogenase/reductase SDR family member 11 [Tetrabaena socialis]|eukprot:PNH10311.1 Dehydrogenase/reductase SDR family member 11 [Tetrabaena socialis]